MSTITSATHSEGENVSEIQSLTLRVQSLSHSVDWWNTAMIWGLALAAIAAVFVVIATRIVVTRTGELSAVQDLLSEAKDRDKDVKIAEAQRGATEASAKAEGFRLEIAKANESAAEAQAKVAGATAEAAKATLELSKLKMPRVIPRDKEPDLSAALGAFSGQEFAGYTFQDQESMDLANAIGRILVGASWRIGKPESDIVIGQLGITPVSGVHVEIAQSQFDGNTSVRLAAEALVGILKSVGIDSVCDARNPARAKTPNIIHVLIGKKPI
jgi:hypothetical protein